MGFGVDPKPKKREDMGDILKHVQPEDLIQYGLIPELVGRLPVLANLENLDEAALVEVLTRPKNALVKQYQKMFSLEGVELSFNEDSLKAIARLAIKRGSGARGLRSILEEILLSTMYELPEQSGLQRVVIDGDVVAKKKDPIRVYESIKKTA